MPPRRRDRNGRFISNFEADYQDRIDTLIPESDESFETASERGDEEMTGESSTASAKGAMSAASTAVDQLPNIGSGQNRLKSTNFSCELLDYDNVKDWKTRMKQLLSLQKCWKVMEATIEMRKNRQDALLNRAMDNEI